VSIKKDVTSRTIAAVIAAPIIGLLWWFWKSLKPIVETFWGWISVLFEWIGGCIAAAFGWFTAGVVLQKWWFFVLFASFLWLFWHWIQPFIVRSRNPSEPTYLDFKKLSHFGIVWRWNWKSGAVNDLSGFCPKCDRHIRYREDSMHFTYFDPTVLCCTNCPTLKIEVPDRRFDDILNDVKLEIDHAVRTGAWKRHVGQIA